MVQDKIWLYLDDVRTPVEDNWQVVRNYDEFVAHIKLNGLENYECISLDHDLGEEAMREYYRNVAPNSKLDYNNIKEHTGMDCARFLVDLSFRNNIPLPKVYVHSANPVGTENIIRLINNYLENTGLTASCVKVKISHTFTNTLSETDIQRRRAIKNGDL